MDSTIARLQELGVNLLAIDFDLTLIDVHTGGRWKGSTEELCRRVRSEFRQLIHAAIENDIRVAIVTFSVQVDMVKGVVESVVGPERATKIPIRGADRSWQYNGSGSQDRKQPFIASVVEELEQRDGIQITKSSTLLIDDDSKNVTCALNDGTRAVWFNPDKPHR